MSRFRYEINAHVLIRDEMHRFIEKSEAGIWYLKNLSNNSVVGRSTEELNALYMAGDLIGSVDQNRSALLNGNERPRVRPAVSDLPEKAQFRIETRRAILEAVARKTLRGTLNTKIAKNGDETTLLKESIDSVCSSLGVKRISTRTYYRWLATFMERGDSLSLQGKFSSSRNPKLHPRARQIVLEEMNLALEEAADKRTSDRPSCAPMRTIRLRIAERIKIENAREVQERLAEPSRATCYKLWRTFPAYDRDIATFGKTRARAMYRASHGHEPKEACLDVVEYDETRLHLFLYDEYLKIPLGRPWLSWLIDVYSRMPLGFYVGYEPPSDLVLSSALRHACLPKTYVAEEYPSIKNRYLAMGIPNQIVFDNGLPQHGHSIRDITLALNCDIDYAPSRTPWFKATVEGMFKNLNTLLLREMPGFVISHIDGFDYDPKHNACLGLGQFLTILHHWLIDIYCQRPWGTQNLSPARRWEEGTSTWQPDLLSSASDLDVIFGIVRQGTLDHRGVVFEGVRYFSDDLQRLRYQCGSNTKVRIKVNPSNLGKVYVWLNSDQAWLPVAAVPQMRHIAEKRSLHTIRIIRKFARENFNRTDADALHEAEWNLQRLISETVTDGASVRLNSLAARFFNYGTQSIFGSQATESGLGHLDGPNQVSSRQEEMPIVPASANDSPTEPKRRRKIPSLHVDRSLSRLDD